jgi:hypothetical protein
MAASLLALLGCAGGYYTSERGGVKKVYRMEKSGEKTLVYEVDKDGKTVFHDPDDPKAKQEMKRQEMARKMARKKVERQERLRNAPKRKPTDPIRVALMPMELDDNLKKAEHTEGAVFEQFKKEFEGDKVIRLVSEKDLKRAQWAQVGRALAGQNPESAPVSDVEVVSRGYLKKVYGVNKKTGKPASVPAVVFEATIRSNYLEAEYTVSEQGHILRNVQVTKKFAAKVKDVIINKIGPTLPADREL